MLAWDTHLPNGCVGRQASQVTLRAVRHKSTFLDNPPVASSRSLLKGRHFWRITGCEQRWRSTGLPKLVQVPTIVATSAVPSSKPIQVACILHRFRNRFVGPSSIQVITRAGWVSPRTDRTILARPSSIPLRSGGNLPKGGEFAQT